MELVNNAKKVLTDDASRNDYNNALNKYGLNDGLTKDDEFEAKLSARKSEAQNK